MSLLLIEQNVAVAERGSDRAYVMSLGRVVKHVDRGGWPDFAQSELVTAYLGKH